MGSKIVLAGLVDKRARLAGELILLINRRIAIEADITRVDSVLALFGFQGPPEAIPMIRKRAASMFKRGHLSRMIANIGREKPELQTDLQLALEVVSRKGWDASDRKLCSKVRVMVKNSRKSKRRRAKSRYPDTT
jgi:hypothetical protein